MRLFAEAGRIYMAMWQDVENKHEDLCAVLMQNLPDQDLSSCINVISKKVKDIKEVGLCLIHDAAIMFFLADEERPDKDSMHRYPEGERPNVIPWSTWPKLGSPVKYGPKRFETGTPIAEILEDIKGPLDTSLSGCTTYREVAENLCYYYLVQSSVYNIQGYFSAHMECIIGQSAKIPKERQLEILNKALAKCLASPVAGNSEWILSCISVLDRT